MGAVRNRPAGSALSLSGGVWEPRPSFYRLFIFWVGRRAWKAPTMKPTHSLLALEGCSCSIAALDPLIIDLPCTQLTSCFHATGTRGCNIATHSQPACPSAVSLLLLMCAAARGLF